ncbi:MAG: cytochrome c [Anaerolineales bacterium]
MLPDHRTLTQRMRRLVWLGLAVGGLMALSACQPAMTDQPRFEPLEANPFFANGMASRPLVPDTVARGQLNADPVFYTGKTANGDLVQDIPVEVDAQLLERGQQRFEIYCAPCHGLVGDGNGIVVQRGFPSPPSYHTDRLRNAPAGHFFDVITNGFGRMYDYSDRVAPADRWAIVAYIRALQLSQDAPIDSAPADVQQQLKSEASQ